MSKECVNCEKFNMGICYTTNPPQYFIDGEYTIEIPKEERLDKLLKEVEE